MTISISNSETGTKVQNPIVVNSCPPNARRVNFKAQADKFERQSYPPAPIYDRQEEMIRQAQAEQKKKERRNNIITGLSVAASVVMIAYFGRAMFKDFQANKVQKETEKAMQEFLQNTGANKTNYLEVAQKCKNPKIKKAIIDELGSNAPSSKKLAALQKLDTIKEEKLKIVDIDRAKQILDDEVIGETMEPIKEKILEFLRYRNYCIKNNIPLDKPFVLALDGPAGTAKTRLSAAIAKACDMPYKEINCAGTTGKNILAGNKGVYSGSSWGEVADAQIEHGTKQVVYTFDELEKAGSSDHNGRFLDSAVSIFDDRHKIKDEFLDVDIDLKDSILVITTNEFEKLGELYESRVGSYLFKIPEYTIGDKINVGKFKMGKFLKHHQLEGKVNVTDEAYKVIAENVKDQGGRQVSNDTDRLIRAVINQIEQGEIAPTTEKPFVITPKEVIKMLNIQPKS